MSLFSPYTLKIGYRILGSKLFSLRILEAILLSSGFQCHSNSKSLVYDFFSKSFLDLLFVFNIRKFHNDKSHVDLFLFIDHNCSPERQVLGDFLVWILDNFSLQCYLYLPCGICIELQDWASNALIFLPNSIFRVCLFVFFPPPTSWEILWLYLPNFLLKF